MTTLIWLDLPPRDGAGQMAMDMGMLDVAMAHGHEIVRLYRWDRPTVSFGANESALRHWDRGAMERAGLAAVRRPTGGRAVWHDPEDLTYSWAGPSGGPVGVRERYRRIHELIAGAISRNASLAPPPARLPGLSAGACFDVPVGGEVLLGRRKIVGSAQVTIGAGLLQHGAVAREDRAAALAPFRIGGEPAADAGPEDPLPPGGELAAMIAERWLAEGAEPLDDPGIMAEVTTTARQHLVRFSDPEWTWRR